MAPTNPPKLSPVFHGLVKEVAFSRLIRQALRSGEGFPLGPSVISKAQNKKRLRRYSGVIESPPDPLEGVQSKSRCYVVGGVMQEPRNRDSCQSKLLFAISTKTWVYLTIICFRFLFFMMPIFPELRLVNTQGKCRAFCIWFLYVFPFWFL